MNLALINNWNDVVTEHDDVYVLGDLFMGNPAEWWKFVIQLNYKNLRVTVGNHDKETRIQNAFDQAEKPVEFYSDYYLLNNENIYWMAHHPIYDPHRPKSTAAWTRGLCGHVHDKKLYYEGIHGFPGCLNVGVDVSGIVCGRPYSPIAIEEVNNWFEENIDGLQGG
jgi:calcineurin-like phosphoesterase family protein